MRLLALALLAGCSRSAVTVVFDNAPSDALRDEGVEVEFLTPESYGQKMLAVYLSEDIDLEGTWNNLGETAMVYRHPDCPEIGQCDVASNGGGVVIEDFFEFARPSEEVNAELKAEPFGVPPGTWRYVRIEWCKQPMAADMTSFQTADMAEPYAFPTSECGTTVAFDEPLVTTGSETIDLHIAYDLTGVIGKEEGPCPDGVWEGCTSDGTSHWYRHSYVPFTPSITLEALDTGMP